MRMDKDTPKIGQVVKRHNAKYSHHVLGDRFCPPKLTHTRACVDVYLYVLIVRVWISIGMCMLCECVDVYLYVYDV